MPGAGDAAQRQAQKEAIHDPGGIGSIHGLEWLFRRKVPTEVKKRFFAWSDIKSLRLSNLQTVENANIIISQLDTSINLYLSERVRKGKELTEEILDWLNQLKAMVRLNLMASLGDNRDMELLTTSRGEWSTKLKQEKPQEGG